jgi:hypothetical protein
MERPSGSWLIDEETGNLAPDLNDQAMAGRVTETVKTNETAVSGGNEEVPDV